MYDHKGSEIIERQLLIGLFIVFGLALLLVAFHKKDYTAFCKNYRISEARILRTEYNSDAFYFIYYTPKQGKEEQELMISDYKVGDNIDQFIDKTYMFAYYNNTKCILFDKEITPNKTFEDYDREGIEDSQYFPSACDTIARY
jgi:hypothetical protein